MTMRGTSRSLRKATWVGLVLKCIVLVSQVGMAHGCGKPNIVFVLADDLGVGDTSIPGYAVSSSPYQIQTPNLERMARNGASYLRAYAPAPVCGPSRYSFLSGRHTGHMQIRGNTGVNDDFRIPCSSTKEDMLAKVLKENGYHTAIIGKWGFKNHPFECGFDKFYGQLTHVDAHSFFPTRMYDNVIEQPNIRNPNLYLPKNRFAKEDVCASSRIRCNFTHDLFTHESIAYLRERATKPDPFFLFLSYSTPHVGAWRPSEDILRYRDKLHMVAPESTCPDDIIVPSTSNRLEECRHKTAVEDYLDRDLGTILDLLEELSLSSNTLVAFAADNGPDFNLKLDGEDIHTRVFKSAGNRVGQKRDLYEGGILTPFVLQWPGKIQPQTMHSQLASITDLFMTFIKVSKSEGLLKHPEVIDGISLLPVMAGESRCGELDCCSFEAGKVEHEFLFWEYCDQQVRNWDKIKGHPERFCSRAVQTEEGFKLIYNHHTQGYELFQVDPSRNFMIDETQLLPGSHQQVAPLKSLLETSRISLKASGYDGTKFVGEHIFTPFPTTSSPTDKPTRNPTTLSPTRDPTTLSPTAFPTTSAPSSFPTFEPTDQPTRDPTFEPTFEPVTDPTSSPTPRPSTDPTSEPTTAAPSGGPTSMPTPATNAPTQSPVVPTLEPTAFDLSKSRCEDQARILIKTQVISDPDCLGLCREEKDCKFLSFSEECSCCLLYRACDSPRYESYESQGSFTDWKTSAVWFTEQPTLEPTSSPSRNVTATIGRNELVESGVLGVAAMLTTLFIVFGVVCCIVLAKFNRNRERVKDDEFSRSDSSEGSTDDSFHSA